MSPNTGEIHPKNGSGGAVAVRRGDVEGWVLVEEADRLEGEAGVLDGHHRPVLRAGDMVDAERVPGDAVGVLDRAVAGRVRGQPLAAGRQVRVASGAGLLGRVG